MIKLISAWTSFLLLSVLLSVLPIKLLLINKQNWNLWRKLVHADCRDWFDQKGAILQPCYAWGWAEEWFVICILFDWWEAKAGCPWHGSAMQKTWLAFVSFFSLYFYCLVFLCAFRSCPGCVLCDPNGENMYCNKWKTCHIGVSLYFIQVSMEIATKTYTNDVKLILLGSLFTF